MKPTDTKKAVFFAAVIGFLAMAEPAWATQTHGQPEGLYVHQMAHIFFIISMGGLEFWLRQRNLTRERGWEYIQIAAVLFILWNIDAGLVHLMDGHLNILGITKVDLWRLTIENFKGQESFVIVYYVLKLDHLLCVPAMFCLYYGLKTILKNTTSTDKDGAAS